MFLSAQIRGIRLNPYYCVDINFMKEKKKILQLDILNAFVILHEFRHRLMRKNSTFYVKCPSHSCCFGIVYHFMCQLIRR